MFLAMVVGAYGAGIFHLMTHAFFKACLFLGSGSVIMACHHEQDIRKMGGLKKLMPTTYWTFLVSTLAIAGIFPLSGFFSKDEILWQAFSSSHGSVLLWALGVGAAVMTAFYMFRLVYLTFFGEYRGGGDHGHGDHGHAKDDHGHDHGADAHGHGHGGTPHESPKTMTVPLQILAVLALLAGFLNVPPLLGDLVGWKGSNSFHVWLDPVLAPVVPGQAPAHDQAHAADALHDRVHETREHARDSGSISLSEAVARTRGVDSPDPHAAGAPASGSTEHPADPAGNGHGTGVAGDAHAPATAGAAETHEAPGTDAHGVAPSSHGTEGHGAGAHGAEAHGAADHAGAEAHGAGGHGHHDPALEFGLMLFSLLVAFTGIGLATQFYLKDPRIPARLQKQLGGVYTLMLNKYYVDEIYQAVIVENFYRLMRFLAWFDTTFVDGFVNLVGRVTVLGSWITGKFDNIVIDGFGVNGIANSFMVWGRNLRLLQTGKVQSYLMFGLLGLLMIIVFRIL